MMKRTALVFALAWLCAQPAAATPFTLTLDGVTLSDGGTWAGSLTFDDAHNKDWSIVASGGDTATFPAFTYTPLTSQLMVATANVIWFRAEPAPGIIRTLLISMDPSWLATSSPIDPTSGAQFSRECFECNPFRVVIDGSLVLNGDIANYGYLREPTPLPTPVPEPSALLLLGSGLFAAYRRRRRHAVASSICAKVERSDGLIAT